ncbi:MAG: DUF1566 domain-containing protein [Paludibacteraceae bacterium]|nr:DUF1566 domain-containing protein [Paludibacteraceae bacterium]
MKKLILSLVTMASLAFAANAVTFMRVHSSDGHIVVYDVKEVTEVDYEETVDGVTVSGKEGIYTYVDLGLPSGTKWATYNVGATKPTEYGDYFAWGETKPKEDYSWSTYKWCTVDAEGYYDKSTKYCTDSDYGTVDNKKVLEAADDAATANWGSAWRMPTTEEMDELIDGCSWMRVKDFNGTGIAGYLCTSVYNGATIFLPAAGFRLDTGLLAAGLDGSYWSSSLREYDSNSSYYLGFTDRRIDRFGGSRSYGQSVRAVLR